MKKIRTYQKGWNNMTLFARWILFYIRKWVFYISVNIFLGIYLLWWVYMFFIVLGSSYSLVWYHVGDIPTPDILSIYDLQSQQDLNHIRFLSDLFFKTGAIHLMIEPQMLLDISVNDSEKWLIVFNKSASLHQATDDVVLVNMMLEYADLTSTEKEIVEALYNLKDHIFFALDNFTVTGETKEEQLYLCQLFLSPFDYKHYTCARNVYDVFYMRGLIDFATYRHYIS